MICESFFLFNTNIPLFFIPIAFYYPTDLPQREILNI